MAGFNYQLDTTLKESISEGCHHQVDLWAYVWWVVLIALMDVGKPSLRVKSILSWFWALDCKKVEKSRWAVATCSFFPLRSWLWLWCDCFMSLPCTVVCIQINLFLPQVAFYQIFKKIMATGRKLGHPLRFILRKFIYFLWMCLFPAWVYMHHVLACCPQNPKVVIRSPGTRMRWLWATIQVLVIEPGSLNSSKCS